MPSLWLTRLTLPILALPMLTNAVVGWPQSFLKRQQTNSPNLVTGVEYRDANLHVGIRREIRDLKENYPDQWNLYLLALSALQQVDQNNPLSFYGIASIHGRPYQPWGDAPGVPEKIGKQGYCPHENQLFLGWHRPYIALFEQTLQAHVQALVDATPSNRFAAASDVFRVPYWDWGLGTQGGPVPDFFLTETIDVVRLDGTHDVIWNPLYSYHFHPIMPGHFEGKWASINSTLRWPTTPNSDAVSQEGQFEAAYNGQQQNILDQLSMAFRSNNFEDFSSILENPHGWIHGIVGGGYSGDAQMAGHFWPLEYSAFEPMFMLHHANIDRLFAMYQAAHPDIRMVSSNIGNTGNLFLENGMWVDGQTELLPFRKRSNTGGYWTTDDCWNQTVLGYTYPELQPWQYSSAEEYQASVTASISRLYGGSARSQLLAQKAAAQEISGEHNAPGLFIDVEQLRFTEWMIQTHASECLPPPFVVQFIFRDGPGNNTIDVGTWMVLMPSDQGDMSNSATHQPPYNGTISLTAHLLDRISAGWLKSLDADDVVPYLQDNLGWNVYSGTGPIVGISDEALSIDVFSTEATIPQNPDMPIMYNSNVTAYPMKICGYIGR